MDFRLRTKSRQRNPNDLCRGSSYTTPRIIAFGMSRQICETSPISALGLMLEKMTIRNEFVIGDSIGPRSDPFEGGNFCKCGSPIMGGFPTHPAADFSSRSMRGP